MKTLKLNHFEPRTALVPESTDEMVKKAEVQMFETYLSKDQTAELAAMPPQFSLRNSMSPVQNQSFGPFCTAFCVNSNLEYVNNRIHLSESCINHEAESRWGDCVAGLAMIHAYQAGRDVGIVEASAWPYDPSKTCWNPVPNTNGKPRYRVGTVAEIYRRPSAAVVKNMIEVYHGKILSVLSSPPNFVRLLKQAIVAWNVPASIDVPVWFQSDGHFQAGWEDGPNIHMPTPALVQAWLDQQNISVDETDMTKMEPPNVSGWHCLSICGYDDTQARFIFKNSWGSWWGDAGYGTIPYDYITAFSRGGFIGK